MSPTADHDRRLVALRHELHANPELSGAEERTAARVQAFLAQYAPTTILDGLGDGHGLAAVFAGDQAEGGPTVVLRAELDALPIAEYADRPEKWVEVDWESDTEADFSVEIRVDSTDQKGVLATVAAIISERDSNIENVSMTSQDGLHSTIHFILAVRSRVHLAQIIRAIRAVPQVARITRT